jgi:hypothetical protein
MTTETVDDGFFTLVSCSLKQDSLSFLEQSIVLCRLFLNLG